MKKNLYNILIVASLVLFAALYGVSGNPTLGWIVFGVLVLIDLAIVLIGDDSEDERQRNLRLQSDSICLRIVGIFLLALMIITKKPEYEVVFWLTLAVIGAGRLISWGYQKAKKL